MTQPITGFERDGTWTTLEQEQQFLEQVAQETSLELSEAGRTVNNLPIWRCDLGTGSTMMIVCLQHGTEPASREGALAWIRDLAYSQDPVVLDYLQHHRIVLIPNMNADRLNRGRNNDNDVNLNRDWWQLTQPETIAVQNQILESDPVVVIDAHETSAASADWMPYPAGLPGTHPDGTAIADNGYQRGQAVLADQGYTSELYSVQYLPWAGLSTTAANSHAVGFLSETIMSISEQDRINIQIMIFEMLLGWHQDNREAIAAARDSSLQYALTTSDPVPFPDREYIGTEPAQTANIMGYDLLQPLPQHLIDSHGITVEGMFVPINQPARLAVAALCDPESVQRVVDAERVRRPPSPGSGVWSDTRVILNGLSYEVTHAWIVVNGSRRPIDGPGFKGLP